MYVHILVKSVRNSESDDTRQIVEQKWDWCAHKNA